MLRSVSRVKTPVFSTVSQLLGAVEWGKFNRDYKQKPNRLRPAGGAKIVPRQTVAKFSGEQPVLAVRIRQRRARDCAALGKKRAA